MSADAQDAQDADEVRDLARRGAPSVPRVLFLCSRNSARSRIAEALLFNSMRDRVVVASAGASPAMDVDPLTFETLDDFGIEWRSHRPKGFGELMGEPWDIVITLCDEARESCPIVLGAPLMAHWAIEDPVRPAGDRVLRRQVFARVVRTLRVHIRELDAMLTEPHDRDGMRLRLGRSIGGKPADRSSLE